MKRFTFLLTVALLLAMLVGATVPAFAEEAATPPVVDEETMAEAEAIAQKLAMIEAYVAQLEAKVLGIVEKVKNLPTYLVSLKDQAVAYVMAEVEGLKAQVLGAYAEAQATVVAFYQETVAKINATLEGAKMKVMDIAYYCIL